LRLLKDNLKSLLVSGSPVSGKTIFEITKAPGAAITEDAKIYSAGIPIPIYIGIIEPDIHAREPDIDANSSERVKFDK